MWSLNLTQRSNVWTRLSATMPKAGSTPGVISGNPNLVWPGPRHHAVCWQQRHPISGQNLFFIWGGVSGNASRPEIYKDLYVYDTAYYGWAYVLGTFANPSNVQVSSLNSLIWSNPLDSRAKFYFHSNITIDTASMIEGALVRRASITNPVRLQFEVTNSRIDDASGLIQVPKDSSSTKVSWIDNGGELMGVIADRAVNFGSLEEFGVDRWPSADSFDAFSVLRGSSCSSVWLSGSAAAGRMSGFISRDSAGAVWQTTSAQGPRPTVGSFLLRLSETEFLHFGGRLVTTGALSSELWSYQIKQTPTECPIKTPSVGSPGSSGFPLGYLLAIVLTIIFVIIIFAVILLYLLLCRRRSRTLSARSNAAIHPGGSESNSEQQGTVSEAPLMPMTNVDHLQRHDADCTCQVCRSRR
jgi:hypothetical protein